MHRSIRLAAPLAALALVAGTAGPAAAQTGGTTAKVATGTTTLTLDDATVQALTAAGIAPAPLGSATASGTSVTFPVTGGAADPKTLRGSVNHKGSGVRFAAGARGLNLSNFTYTVTKRGASLSGKVAGGSRAAILRLDLSGATIAHGGLTDTISGVKASLAAPAAAALNKAFGVKAFQGGMAIGTVSGSVTFGEAILTGGATTLALDPGTAAALTSLGVSAAPIAPATAGAGGLAFPITGGRVNASSLAGLIPHSGGILLSGGGNQIALKQFLISTKGTPYLSARVKGNRVRIADLDLSAVTVSVSGGTVTVGGAVVKLTSNGAKALNATFGVTAFTKGLVLGAATVAATLR